MSLKKSIHKIIEALQSHGTIESIQKFTNTQNILKSYGYKNILLLTRQAHVNQMELNDVRTKDEWANLGISPKYFSKPLIVYKQKKLDDGGIAIKEYNAFDITHTDAAEQALLPRETIGKKKDDDYELLFQNLLYYTSNNFDVRITEESNVLSEFYPYSKEIKIDKDMNPIDKINHLLRSLYKESIFGNEIRKFEYLDSPLNNAIAKLILNSYLKRISIEKHIDNDLTFEENEALFSELESSLEKITSYIQQFDKKLNISRFINEEFDVYDETYRHMKEVEDRINKVTQFTPISKPKRKPVEFITLEDKDADELKEKTKDEILITNPLPVLESLHFEIKKEEPHRIQFKAREERSASAYMIIKGSNWIYKDFGGGDDAKGTVINLVMDKLNCEFKEAIQYCCDTLNIPNYFKIKLDEIKYENENRKKEAGWQVTETNIKPEKTSEELLREKEAELIALKEANLKIEKTHSTNSRVTYVSKAIPEYLQDYLKSRGISKTQIDNFYFIKGETWKLNENDIAIDIKQKNGVGVLCADKDKLKELYSLIDEKGYAKLDTPLSSQQEFGADIHFPPIKFLDDKKNEIVLKTQSLGAKKNTTFVDYQGDTIAPVESKMDYAAAAQQIDFKTNKIDVDIANSTSNADMIAKNIAEKKYKNTYFLNQFDVPGVKFIVDICNKSKEEGYEINKFKFIDYLETEYKQDINDLHQNGISLNARTKEGTLKDLQPLLDKIRSVEKDIEKLKELDKVESLLNDSIGTTQSYSTPSLNL